MINPGSERAANLAALEGNLSRILEAQPPALARVLDTLQRDNAESPHQYTKSIFTALQQIMGCIETLNKRLGAYRSADHLAHVSEIYPKTKTVVFAGDGYLGDNIKYAYLSFRERAAAEGIECYFLPLDASQYELLKAAGLPCLPHVFSKYTAHEVKVLLGAKILVLDNHFVPPNWQNLTIHALLNGAKTVQLWHGVPLKQIGLETVANKKIDDPGNAELFASCGTFDVFVAPGAASRADWEGKFSFREFVPLGYPRNDVFFRDISASDILNVDMPALASVQEAAVHGQPVILYAPTFRDHKGSAWFRKAEISAFADYCDARGYLLYVNLHPAEQDSVEQFRQFYPGVNFIAPHTDIYPVVKYADVLVTDYSSLAFDFLLLDRPIVFYRPDHAEYIAQSRPLIEDHDQYVCGAVAADAGELIKAVEDAISIPGKPDIDLYREARRSLREKLFDHQDGLAAQRLSDEIIKMLDS